MGTWYRVVKTIKGHRYVYEQQTWRDGGRVRTRNRYLGPAGSDAGASVSPGSKGEPSRATVIAPALVGSLTAFGKAAISQFDAPRWGTDAASQLGLVSPAAKPKKTAVTTTKRRHRRHHITGMVTLYDPGDVSPAGRLKTTAIEKVFSRIPDGTTDPRGYVVKQNGRLFPTDKLTAELRSYLGIQCASDGSITEGMNINKTGFTEQVALHRLRSNPTGTSPLQLPLQMEHTPVIHLLRQIR
jgi:hypothetical protein